MTDSTLARLMDAPARYRIRVHGQIASDWASRLSGMTMAPPGRGAGPPITELTGRMPDQAGLLGVLNSLYELGLPLLSVECMPELSDDGIFDPPADDTPSGRALLHDGP